MLSARFRFFILQKLFSLPSIAFSCHSFTYIYTHFRATVLVCEANLGVSPPNPRFVYFFVTLFKKSVQKQKCSAPSEQPTGLRPLVATQRSSVRCAHSGCCCIVVPTIAGRSPADALQGILFAPSINTSYGFAFARAIAQQLLYFVEI